MTKKQILAHDEASKKIQIGVDKLANAVKSTLGPGGSNVVLKRVHGIPLITKDGVTVAREITLEDPIEDVGAQLVKAVAIKTVNTAGDGTTTACVLAQAIYNEGIKSVTIGANAIELKRGIDLAVEKVVAEIKSKAIPATPENIAQVAIVATNNDQELGPLVAKAVLEIGVNGIVTTEESRTTENEVKIIEGMQFGRGFLSPYFITDQAKAQCILENPFIIVTEKKISSMNPLLPVLERIAQTGRPMLIICDEMEDQVISTLAANKMRGALRVCAVKAPGGGDYKKPWLDDICTVAGAHIISDAVGTKMETMTLDKLGEATKVIIDKEKTIIVGGKGTKEAIQDRVSKLIKQREDATTDFEKEVLSNRIAKMDGGVAVICIAASSEIELKEKMDRLDDAIRATQAAMAEGIVPGGGVAYLKALYSLHDLLSTTAGDRNTGMQIILKALSSPFRTIVSNAIGRESDTFENTILNNGDYGYGWDARDKKFKDLITFGIVDPAMVVRLALENAASVAGLLLTTRSVVFELEPKAPWQINQQSNAFQS